MLASLSCAFEHLLPVQHGDYVDVQFDLSGITSFHILAELETPEAARKEDIPIAFEVSLWTYDPEAVFTLELWDGADLLEWSESYAYQNGSVARLHLEPACGNLEWDDRCARDLRLVVAGPSEVALEGRISMFVWGGDDRQVRRLEKKVIEASITVTEVPWSNE